MCTVTFLPKPSGFILTHNRDEAPYRSPQNLVREKRAGGDTLIFPRDTAGGSWIATSSRGRTACLLNGAFILHTRHLPYRRSRGLILLDFFDWEDPDKFFREYDLDQIEPFTFLYFEQNPVAYEVKRVMEFRWNGQERFLKNLPVQEAHFWCSATLYPAEMQARREQVFRKWLEQQQPGNPLTNRKIISLHRHGSVGDPENNYVMNRGGSVQTVSITQVTVDKKNARMRYFDLLGGNRSERRLGRSKRQLLL